MNSSNNLLFVYYTSESIFQNIESAASQNLNIIWAITIPSTSVWQARLETQLGP